MTVTMHRRRAFGLLLGTPFASLVSAVDAEAGDKAKKRKKKKEKNANNPSAAYNSCLVNEPRELCSWRGCASRDESDDCIRCFADIEACCERIRISDNAYCACIESLAGFHCTMH